VTVPAFRIVKRQFVARALLGLGSERNGGRWNSPGIAVVYTAAATSLAALEMLVHLDKRRLVDRFVLIELAIPETVIEPLSHLPPRWFAEPVPKTNPAVGDRWVREGRSAVLRVPSAVIRTEYNYLLNPAHPDFTRIKVGKPRLFRFDLRLGL
jgi:RES domain-containing protein